MSGSFGEMGNLLAQAQKMQKSLEDAREELRDARIEGGAGGACRATVDGMGNLQSLTIAASAPALGSEDLNELVALAVQAAQRQAKKQHDERMAKVTGGMNLPGLL